MNVWEYYIIIVIFHRGMGIILWFKTGIYLQYPLPNALFLASRCDAADTLASIYWLPGMVYSRQRLVASGDKGVVCPWTGHKTESAINVKLVYSHQPYLLVIKQRLQ